MVNSMKQMTTYIDDIKDYLQMRIDETDKHIVAEKLAGNEPKELAEKSAQCELHDVLKFIEGL